MSSLRRNDLASVLDFVADVGGLTFDAPYPVEVLERFRDVVQCDSVTYQELDHDTRSSLAFVTTDLADDPDDDEVGLEVYWSTGPCPTACYRETTGDLTAIRVSDVIPRRAYHELPVYRDYFLHEGVEHVLDLSLPADPGRHRAFVFFRERGGSDFNARDLEVLELIRPHLRRMEETASLRRSLDVFGTERDSSSAALTPREREVVALVAEGKTNAQIAAALWVAPSTVKKHLENVYAKTGLGCRAAAAARYGRP